jgi:undecaprenyl diphosphate synthase
MFEKKLPKKTKLTHVAVIMDGNRRWAKKNAMEAIFGHQNGVKNVKTTIEAAISCEIEFLTLYVFSTENWSREKNEVINLQKLLERYLKENLKFLINNGIKVSIIGDYTKFSKECIDAIEETLFLTSKIIDVKLNLILAINYGGKQDIIRAVNLILKNHDKDKITEKDLENYLYTKNIPEVDLVIRTGGNYRISNFLIWQIAYAELVFLDVLWPDFDKKHFIDVVVNYKNINRTYGG